MRAFYFHSRIWRRGERGTSCKHRARAPKGGRIPRPERVFGVCGRSATPRLATGIAQQPSRLEFCRIILFSPHPRFMAFLLVSAPPPPQCFEIVDLCRAPPRTCTGGKCRPRAVVWTLFNIYFAQSPRPLCARDFCKGLTVSVVAGEGSGDNI